MADVSCTAVLIVRDESPVIEACLRSVRDLVDQIVVLDTGSVDNTRELARSLGALVVESEWRDDFAGARNEALAHARGQWILSIDADERVARGSRQDLRGLLAGAYAVAYRVWLQPGALFTHYRHCRLFLNDPRIRFEGRIRESVLPSVRRLTDLHAGVAVDPRPRREPLVGDCDITIDHHDDALVRSAKHARDLRLLRQAIREDEENIVYWTDLGRASVGVGDTAGAVNAWQRAIDLVRRRDGRSLAESLPYADLIQHLPRHDARRDLLLEEASTRFPENSLIVWLRAETLVARRAFADAEGLLRGLVAVDGEGTGCAGLAYDRRIFGEFAFGALATCCFELGRWAEAADWFGRAAAAQPASLEYRVKRDLTVRRRGQTGIR